MHTVVPHRSPRFRDQNVMPIHLALTPSCPIHIPIHIDLGDFRKNDRTRNETNMKCTPCVCIGLSVFACKSVTARSSADEEKSLTRSNASENCWHSSWFVQPIGRIEAGFVASVGVCNVARVRTQTGVRAISSTASRCSSFY